MIVKLNNEYWMCTGTVTRDAQYKCVGDKQTPVTSFSMAAGKNPDTTTIFVECKAWRDLAKVAATFHKGDAVCVIGKIEEREYNGKTYKDLVCEWLWGAVPNAGSYNPLPTISAPAPKAGFSALMDADDGGELPF